MGHYLFEDATIGIILAVAVEIFLLISWLFMRKKFNKLVLLMGPGIICLFVLMDVLVKTNREHLEETTRKIVKAAQEENADAIISLLSDNLLINNRLDKPATADIIRWHLARPLIAKNYIKELLVKSAHDKSGQVEFEVITNIDPKSSYGIIPIVSSRWLFVYVRDPDGPYRVSNMVMLKLADQAGIDVFKKQKLNPDF